MKQESPQAWPEREDRRAVRATAAVHLRDGTVIAVALANISYAGCQIESDHHFGIGEKLKLALPRLGEISAQVRWAIQGRAGLRFLAEEAGALKPPARHGG